MDARLRHRLRALREGAAMDRELEDEIPFHLEMETEKYVREGMDRDAARARALRNFGPMEKHKEESRDARGVSWLEHLVQDTRYGVRTLLKNPGFALVAVLTLGLGIGANTAIFSVINGVLLKPLPYENGDRLVLIRQQAPLTRQQNVNVSITELYDYRAQTKSFDGIVEFHQMNFDLLRRGEPDRVATGVVSPNFFDVLGIRPILGRSFVETDDDEGAEAVLILGHAYWQSKFGGDPNIVGQVFEMNDRPHTVVGVLPSVPHYPNEVDVYMPTSACPFRSAAERQVATNRRPFNVQVFGLLKPGVSPQTADTEVATVAERFKRDYPEVYPASSGFRATTASVLDELTAGARRLLFTLLGTTSLVLLVRITDDPSRAITIIREAVRAVDPQRTQEFGLRMALGATGRSVLRMVVGQGLVLVALGLLLGFGAALAASRVLESYLFNTTPRDPIAFAVVGVAFLAAGVLACLGPAWRATRVDPMIALRAD